MALVVARGIIESDQSAGGAIEMRVIVTGTHQALGMATAEGLRGRAFDVVALGCAPADRGSASRGVADAIETLGGLDLLVVTGWSDAAVTPVAFEDLDDEAFEQAWEGGMQGMLWTLQAAIPALRTTGGNVVVVVPTTGMTGGSNYAVGAATFEGQRILMKAAARQLGQEGIRVNAIAVGAESVLSDPEAAEVHYLAPPAVPGEPAADDVADVIGFIVSEAGRRLSGQTITIDGGRWLAP